VLLCQERLRLSWKVDEYKPLPLALWSSSNGALPPEARPGAMDCRLCCTFCVYPATCEVEANQRTRCVRMRAKQRRTNRRALFAKDGCRVHPSLGHAVTHPDISSRA
jgi:hypothetical protein